MPQLRVSSQAALSAPSARQHRQRRSPGAIGGVPSFPGTVHTSVALESGPRLLGQACKERDHHFLCTWLAALLAVRATTKHRNIRPAGQPRSS